jgi:hypothetical protein
MLMLVVGIFIFLAHPYKQQAVENSTRELDDSGSPFFVVN